MKCLLFISLGISSLFGYELVNAPAREWLENSYLPSLSGKILYVGVGDYTQKYPFLTQTPKQFVTLDYDIEKASFGSPFGHYSCDLLTFQTDTLFDHVSLFGIMGHPSTVTTSKYNILDDTTISEAIYQADLLVNKGGTLQLGPNHKDFPGQDADFWLEQFSKPPLDTYELLSLTIYSDNIVWWGKK
jgi:hypothetical protein